MIEQEANLPVGNVPGLTELDLACGAMLGYDGRPSLPDPVTVADPEGLRRLIGSQLVPALTTGRCLVPFSGGRDSSAILALSAETARRQGLPDPIPVTLRFPEASRGGEEQAQELVVRRLGLAEWERIDIQSELEVLGPTARGVLRRLGILFPSTAYTLVPMLERASGGTLVVGTGSSDFYLYWRWAKLADVLVGNRRPVRADARSVGTALLPGALRGALASRHPRFGRMPWLRPKVEREVVRRLAGRSAEVPMRCGRAILTQVSHRCHGGTMRSLQALARASSTEIVLPLAAPEVIATLVAEAGWRGIGGREHWIRLLGGPTLPEEVVRRSESTDMGKVLFGPGTRAFAERWSGRGLPESLVDTERLRQLWLDGPSDWRMSSLFQLAWMHDHVYSSPTAERQRAPAAPV